MTPEEIEEMINQSIANFVKKYKDKYRLIKIFLILLINVFIIWLLAKRTI